MSKLVIHAVNVHQGGGERLLKELLGSLDPCCLAILNVDQRMPLPTTLPVGLEVRRVRRSFLARLFAELWLWSQTAKSDCILCFGNLPPLFRVKAFTSVFVQNRYLIDGVSLKSLKTWLRIRIQLERLWLRLTIGHADQYLVQTPSMQLLMLAIVRDATPVLIAPFAMSAGNLVPPTAPAAPERLPNFVYVASGEDHKNHRRLLQAWSLLATEDIRPLLVLTIDLLSFPELCAWIDEQIKVHALKVTNLGVVDVTTLAEVYGQSDALIYPSQLESFGLPLMEASAAGLDVLAAELDYVRDIVCPVQSFDTTSALSIARAVKRYCGYHDPALQLLSPAQFLGLCLRRLE